MLRWAPAVIVREFQIMAIYVFSVKMNLGIAAGKGTGEKCSNLESA